MTYRFAADLVSSPSFPRSWRTAWCAGLALALVTVVLLPAPQAIADDTELLRSNSSNPFLFIVLDNSRSMAASIGDQWVHAGADDPRSRLYIAKEVLYEELQSLSDVHYGLATFNQDEVRVVSKHYLYYVADTTDNANEIALMPSNLGGYPVIEPNDEISYTQIDLTTGADETIVAIDGDLLTLGRTFPFDSGGVQTPAGGTCAAPLSLSMDREAINRYPKFGEDGDETVIMWVRGNANTLYRIIWKRPLLATWSLGDPSIEVIVNITEPNNCDATAWGLGRDYTLELRLWKPFLWVDDDVGADTGIGGGGGGCGATNADEIAGGFWSLDPLDVDVITQCVDKPFSGQGWEGNYDSGHPHHSNHSYEASLSTVGDVFDNYCFGGSSNNACVNNKYETVYASTPDEREIDLGDMVPWHWNSSYHDTLLSRLNPNHNVTTEDFGVAKYFTDTTSGTSGSLVPISASRKPILAAGNSPIGAAALDFRCWFVGEGSNKCNRSGSFRTTYDTGFLSLLESEDTGLWACRRPFMIVITDLYGNCTANSNVANIAGMFSDTSESGLKNGVSTWLLNLGQRSCNGFTNAGKGETIDVASKSDLRTVLRQILGEIEETSRAFASAAVPTVQADVQDKIYFTQFTPLDLEGRWPGEILSFPKPLPLIEEPQADGTVRLKPDRSKATWNARVEMRAQAPDRGSLAGPYYTRNQLMIGDQAAQRRVYYMVEPKVWNYFAPVEGADSTNTYTANELRNDLWQAMGLSFPPLTTETLVEIKADTALDATLQTAHSVIHNTLIEKEAVNKFGFCVLEPPDNIPCEFVLGDIFHSNPQVLGAPGTAAYLADPASYPDYDSFAERHERRRRMLFVGANDGMLHTFDVGRWEGTFEDGSFNEGSGREVLGYVPREAIPGLKALNENRQDHRWFVDATPQIADVLIDVSGDGKREWRTVLIGGLRRGGASVFALDVTQPDPVEVVTRTIGGTSVDVGYLPTTNDIVPSCWADSDALPSNETIPADGNCDAASFGLPLWEISDPTDDDLSGRTDMGQTWSAPEIGAIRVNNTLDGSTDPQLRWVAIFGGGLDPDWASDTGKGNWLYMVDIETGKIIYKRRLGDGSAAAPPAAVDTDRDGVLDRIYVGTTLGQLWRVDMSTVPDLVAYTDGSKCTRDAYDGLCIDDNDVDWEPELFFDTLTTETDIDNNSVQQRRPFFFAPTVFYVGQLGGFGVAVGTGNRDDIWAAGPVGGNRFYVFADEVCKNSAASTSLCQAATDLPLFQGDLVNVSAGDAACTRDVVTDVDARVTGERGWYVELGITAVASDTTNNQTDTFFDAFDELMVTPSVSISGLTVFNTFVPETQRTRTNDGPQCARRGISRSYLYFTASGCQLASYEVADLVSDIYRDRRQTQNEPPTPCVGIACPPPDPDPCDSVSASTNQRVRDELFPSTCRFSDTYSFPLMMNQSNIGINCLVEIPVCIQQRNWKEF